MKKLDVFQTLLKEVFVTFLIIFTFQGSNCQLVLQPAGPTQVNALVGTNVTLAVSFSGAPNPLVSWSRSNITVGTWTINSNSSPDIAPNSRDVLRIENNGSLTFLHVPLGYTGNYTIELAKSGLEKVSRTFTLRIFENFQSVSLNTQSDFAKEGTESFTLKYSMLHGVVEQQMWQFNGKELKNSSHYLIEGRSLVILRPNRSDAGLYSLLLTNPFSSAAARKTITILYGPDAPVVGVQPAQLLYKAGDSLSLSCQAEGFPSPVTEWTFDGQILPNSNNGVLNLTNVQTSQGGVYTCTLLNTLTAEKREKSLTLKIFEKPGGSPMCSVVSVNDVSLQYQCRWPGGTPQAQLSFPALSNNSNGAENFSLTVTASADLNKKTVICIADHPLEQNKCNVSASAPMKFLPIVETSIDPSGKIVVSISCLSGASPQAAVSWSRGNETVTNGTTQLISSSTEQLRIYSYNVSSFLVMPNYTCVCYNLLGSQTGKIQVQGPSISDSSLFPNQNGTIITLTWEVPPTAIVTGFGIQMKGPALHTKSGIVTKASSDGYVTIQSKLGSARSADIFPLDPKSTYWFRIIPKARLTDGVPSKIHRAGPGEGLSGSAIAGIAAGIPCSILFLALLCVTIYLILYCSNKKKNQQPTYPVSRAVAKTKNSQTTTSPHKLLTGGLASPPDYNRLHKNPSERTVPLPTFVPPPPVRVATTV
nr:V-set and immunoglobulin domain-containing protein 10-like [Nothobranchius furzeri]